MKLFISVLTFLLVVSCVSETKKPSRVTYWDLPTSHRMPANEQERQEECARIRQEMARVESIAEVAQVNLAPLYAASVRVKARQNLAALESRAAEVGCSAAFTNIPNKKDMSFDECFDKCKKYTNRSNEECFDSCNK